MSTSPSPPSSEPCAISRSATATWSLASTSTRSKAAERWQLRARLDALFCHLDGLEDEASYVLDQFHVLAKNERKQFGQYLTKQISLGHYKALAAGDAESVLEE